MDRATKPLRQRPWFGVCLFALIMSGIMSFLVTGLTTLKVAGVIDGFFIVWMNAWALAWSIAFPTLLVGRPFVMRFVGWVTRPD
ncbi:MAG: DUF2798 domain-containing protein [Pseudomonadota bacterium]